MITFRHIDYEDLEMVGRWREKPRVTKYMATDCVYSEESQRKWFEGLVEKAMRKLTWVIECDFKPIGLINMADTSWMNRKTSWGYYIGEDDYTHLGAFIPCYFYNMIFSKRFNTIQAEVFSANKPVIAMHLLHGYEIMGVDIGGVKKNGKSHDITIMHLARETWESKKRFHHLEWKQ